MINHEGMEKYDEDILFNVKNNILKKGARKLERILMIGPDGPENLFYLSHHLYYEFKKLGIDVKYYGRNNIGASIHVKNRRMFFPLNNLLQKLEGWKPDFIFVEECLLPVRNTTNIPSAYHHREFRRPHEFYYPSIEYCNQPNLMDFYEKWNETMWCAQVPTRKLLPLAYSPDIFSFTKKKKYKGITTIGLREGHEESLKRNELTRTPFILLLMKEAEDAKPYITNILPPQGDESFREKLSQVQMYYCIMACGQYCSRRILEAMASGAQVILKIQSKEQEDTLKDEYFLERGVHYIGIDSVEELADVTYDHEMVKRAYDIVKEHHTYKNRVKQIIEDFYAI
jgi:hypothetical protein